MSGEDVLTSAGADGVDLDPFAVRVARRDDPGELAARLADLQARIAARAEQTTARRDEPATGRVSGWRTVGREQAAQMLAGRGLDLNTARALVTNYLRDTSERAGAPADQWGLDQADIAAIAATHHRTDTDGELDDAHEDAHDDDAGWAR